MDWLAYMWEVCEGILSFEDVCNEEGCLLKSSSYGTSASKTAKIWFEVAEWVLCNWRVEKLCCRATVMQLMDEIYGNEYPNIHNGVLHLGRGNSGDGMR